MQYINTKKFKKQTNTGHLLLVLTASFVGLFGACQERQRAPNPENTTGSREDEDLENRDAVDRQTESTADQAPLESGKRESNEKSAGSVRTDSQTASSHDADRVLAVLPGFDLTDQLGNPYSSRQLYTKVWIANFIFTHCAATCPAQTAKLQELQISTLRPRQRRGDRGCRWRRPF